MNVTLPRNVRPGSASTVMVARVPTRTAAASCSKIATSTHSTRASAIWNRLSPAFTAWPSMTIFSVTAPGARGERVVFQPPRQEVFLLGTHQIWRVERQQRVALLDTLTDVIGVQ